MLILLGLLDLKEKNTHKSTYKIEIFWKTFLDGGGQ